MPSENPSKAIDAIIPSDKAVCGQVIQKFTLGIIAILERIESPLLNGGDCSNFGLIPTMYVLCHNYRDTLKAIDDNTFAEKAFEWADGLQADQLGQIGNTVVEMLQKAFDVADDGSKKKQDE